MKKAFTLAEILIVMSIIAVVALVMIKTLNPKKYEEKTNLASARKTYEVLAAAMSQVLDMEATQCPSRAFMVKPAGLTSYEFAIFKTDGSTAAGVTEIVSLFCNHLKCENTSLSFKDYSTYVGTDSTIKGAKLASGAYFGIKKYDSITDCPAYRPIGETANVSAPTKFNPKTGANETVKCWGQLYIDVNGKDGKDLLGEDVYFFGLGELGFIR